MLCRTNSAIDVDREAPVFLRGNDSDVWIVPFEEFQGGVCGCIIGDYDFKVGDFSFLKSKIHGRQIGLEEFFAIVVGDHDRDAGIHESEFARGPVGLEGLFRLGCRLGHGDASLILQVFSWSSPAPLHL